MHIVKHVFHKPLIILSAQVYNKITRRNIKIDLRIYNRKLYCVKVYQHIWTSKSIFFLIHMLLTIFIHSLNYLNCHMEVKILMSDVSHLFIHHFVICVGSIINVQLEELKMCFLWTTFSTYQRVPVNFDQCFWNFSFVIILF